jgi:hypothetical protein
MQKSEVGGSNVPQVLVNSVSRRCGIGPKPLVRERHKSGVETVSAHLFKSTRALRSPGNMRGWEKFPP